MAYDGLCVTGPAPRKTTGNGAAAPSEEITTEDARNAANAEMPSHGVLVARAGVGFPGPVHLERFASPARLCVTDEPRIAGVGGIGMLTLVVPPPLLARALAHGTVTVRAPVSVQVLLSGRLRPFVCARDVALELLRRGIGEAVRRAEEVHGAPVVLEFAGPSARALSVGERSVLAALAPQVGAAGGLFVSDERTEVFLRDQRRSKAHRALAPDAGAPCEDVINLDLGAVDPLVLDEQSQVRAVRDLAGRPVTQVVLGGDGGVTLRDLLAAAALLKSKRVPPRLDFLVAVPSRQMLRGARGERRAHRPHRDRRATGRARRADRVGRDLSRAAERRGAAHLRSRASGGGTAGHGGGFRGDARVCGGDGAGRRSSRFPSAGPGHRPSRAADRRRARRAKGRAGPRRDSARRQARDRRHRRRGARRRRWSWSKGPISRAASRRRATARAASRSCARRSTRCAISPRARPRFRARYARCWRRISRAGSSRS